MTNILLIESKQCDREILPILLEKMGFQLMTAESPKEAYKFLENIDPPVVNTILMSTETIDKEYLDFMNWVKRMYPAINVIATSCRPSDEKVCKTCGVPFVPKPIMNVWDLGQMLRN